jgi:CheY-like chemotaxis protein
MLKMHHDTVQTTPTTNDRRPLAPIPRILVVDGNHDTRELYRHWFQLSGCHVVEASDGRDALTKALVSPPSLVVTEISLPFLDGYLCEILRRDRATADVPILVLTAARPADMDRARRAGADIVVAKPTPPDHIVSLSRRLIDEVKDLRGQAADKAAAPSEISESALADPGERRRTVLVKAHSRFTTTTLATPAASLICPWCDSPLAYDRSHIGGVSDRQREQWDYYMCNSCGAFQYRQRTRKLRRVDSVP